jgi:hypothetical protein
MIATPATTMPAIVPMTTASTNGNDLRNVLRTYCSWLAVSWIML